MLRNFHVNVEFFYSFHLKNLICCRFDVEDFCLGFMFRIYVSEVSSRCQTVDGVHLKYDVMILILEFFSEDFLLQKVKTRFEFRLFGSQIALNFSF